MAGSEKKKADDLLQEGYAKYYTAIYRYALSRLGDPHKSEDVAQEAFVVYYKRLRTGEVFTAPRAFLYRTADHLVQKQFDRQKRAQNCITLDEVIEIPAQNADPDERLTFEEYSRQISAALSDTDAALFSWQRPTPDRGNRPYRKRPEERHLQADQHHPHLRAEQQRRHLHPCRLHRRDKQQGGRQPELQLFRGHQERMQLDERKLGEVKKRSTRKAIKKHTTSSTACPSNAFRLQGVRAVSRKKLKVPFTSSSAPSSIPEPES